MLLKYIGHSLLQQRIIQPQIKSPALSNRSFPLNQSMGIILGGRFLPLSVRQSVWGDSDPFPAVFIENTGKGLLLSDCKTI